MVQENTFTAADEQNDAAEELTLEFDGSWGPDDVVWEWNGEAWIAVSA
jgi:hypothetical protein